MTIQEILNKYQSLTQIEELNNTLNHSLPSHTLIKGAVNSAKSFIISAISNNTIHPQLIIVSDKEEAAYLLNDLENIIPNKNVLYFPTPYRKPYTVEDVDNANVLMRAEVLNQLSVNTKNKIIVTYAEALAEKVVSKQHLKENTLELNKGEKINIDFIVDVLHSYEFERVDYVVNPGQYSVRGGIVDIFSYAYDNPYRVEFFGNEVDSIRSFDTASQLSIHKFEKINIVPNIEHKLVRESRSGLLDFLPKETIIWLKESDFVLSKIDKEYASAESIFATMNETIKHIPPHELYVNSEYYTQKFKTLHCIEFGNTSLFEEITTINFNCQAQPTFNKNFDLLIENLKSNVNKGFKNLLFTDSPKQVERIYSILEDIHTNKGHKFSTEEFTAINLSLHEGFIDNDLKIACYTDHQIFDRYHRFKLKSSYKNKSEALTLKELQNLQPGDFVSHIDHGVGKFAGLEKIDVNGKQQEAIRLVYKDNDILYVSIHSLHKIAKFSGQEGHAPKINKLGSNAWVNLKQKTKARVKEVAFDLIQLYAKRRALQGFEFLPDTYLQTELEASFIYEDTPDQVKATAAVKKDMEAPYPMDRLVCGDVGFGKTEIAVRAAFKAVADSKQVAILVPTTILALQHYKTFRDRLKDFPCNVDYINRFRSAKDKKETLQKLVEGKVDILIGTHAIVGKDVKFKDLGLLIIDEEQKFGVTVKEKLKTIRNNVDSLTLTATPIPRTLQFSMMGARDLSVISTPPPNRHPVQTELHVFNEELIRDAISFEVSRGGQVFFIHNRVQNIGEVAGMIQRLCPEVKVAIGHGQLDGDKLEEVMLGFVEGEYDVLVATTIIESGLDISNANTILINSAHMFGLSDLHQMRGRVGRSNKKAFCYLLSPPLSVLTDEARKRLKALEEFSDLGSGFNIAMRDLDIRGAGNLLGAEQSGFINEIGFETYMKILNEAVEELKETEFKDLFNGTERQTTDIRKSGNQISSFVKDCQIDTDLEILFPDEYISNTAERLILYKELDETTKEEDLLQYENNLIDRFGPIPQQATHLINTIRLRWVAMELGLEKLVLKSGKLVGYFTTKHDSPFYNSETFTAILTYVQKRPQRIKIKENVNKLFITFESISTIEKALEQLQEIKKESVF
ncbi:MAG: transcription-repair coupling factor [Bacteroidota bacterium]